MFPDPESVLLNEPLRATLHAYLGGLKAKDDLTVETFRQGIDAALAEHYPEIPFRDLTPGMSASERNRVSQAQVWWVRARTVLDEAFGPRYLGEATRTRQALEGLGDGAYDPSVGFGGTVKAAFQGAGQGVADVGRGLKPVAGAFQFVGNNLFLIVGAVAIIAATPYLIRGYREANRIAKATRK